MVKEHLYKTNTSKNLRKAKGNARNNTNSASCNNCGFANTSWNNNKLSI